MSPVAGVHNQAQTSKEVERQKAIIDRLTDEVKRLRLVQVNCHFSSAEALANSC